MTRSLRITLFCCVLGILATGESYAIGKKAASVPQAAGTQPAPASAKAQEPSGQTAAVPQDLKSVLAEMNRAAANFKSAQADFEWDQFTRVVEEHDIQKGQIYFERNKHGMDAAVKVVSPEPKQVVFKDGQLSLYQPRIDQVTQYKAGSNRQDVESYMSLGFGASGDDLARNFEVKLDGWEPVDGVRTARLELVPKNQKMKASISKVLLWMDPNRNVSLKQQFFEPSGDYRLTHYTNIKLNSHFSDDVFRLRTTSKTKVVQPQ